MAKITETKDTTGPTEDGWSCFYRLERDDGGEVIAEVSCTRTAEATARNNDNHAALDVIDDRAAMLVVEHAEKAQSPLRRGSPVTLRVFFDDGDAGHPRVDYVYPDNASR
jgi:hypothetical protein